MEAGLKQKRRSDFERALSLFLQFKERERWSRRELLGFQQQQLDRLVRYAATHSPFYRDLYRTIRFDRLVRLEDLPVIDKKTVMENFDRIVTDQRLKIDRINDYIKDLTYDDYYLGEYRVLTTTGSTGLRGIFVYNRLAWSVIIAAVNRASTLAGLSATGRMKIASIGANTPLHLSHRRAVSMDLGKHDYRHFEAKNRIDVLVDMLNDYQPEYIHAYATIASLLALEQKEGRLRINPSVIVTSAEVLTDAKRELIRQAWGITPFNSYSTTEGALAIECAYHRGIHLFEDLGIVEVVDARNCPVPDGVPGHKILFTNLYQYVQPIIRYEMSDMMTLTDAPCPCGRPFRRVTSMQGRNDDIITMPGTHRKIVSVPPYFFHSPMAMFGQIREYQIIQKKDGLHIRVVLKEASEKEATAESIKNMMRKELESYQVMCPDIHVKFVQWIERDPNMMGKVKLVKKEL